jgi:hypothetical protein
MSEARYYHVAAALGDGRVLVAGGLGGVNGPSNTAEIDDSAAMAWSPAAAMNRTRAAASAVTLRDGRVLVIGGFDQNAVDVVMDAEVYDPAANSWTLTGPTTGPRFFATSQVLPDGRVLVAGGYDNVAFDSVESAEVFDPVTNSWTAVAPLHVKRVFAASVPLADGRVLVIGGTQGNPAVPWTDGEVYDPASDSWTLTPSTGGAGGGFVAAARRTDGRVLATGGLVDTTNVPTNAAALYDPPTNSWSAVAPMSVARYGHVAVSIPGARTLVAGGLNTDSVETFGAPNNPPTANAGVDQAAQGCAGCLALVTLDGSASTDADGDALTYTWREGDTVLAVTHGATSTATVGFSVGTHVVTLAVTDGAGGQATDTATVVVADAIASMSAQIADLESRLADAGTTIRTLNRALDAVEQDMQREFGNPGFTIPGATPAARARALAEAIVRLDRESKRALYRELQR